MVDTNSPDSTSDPGSPTVTRRLLLTTTIGFATLAGCSGSGDSDEESDSGGSDDADAEAEAQADEGEGGSDSSDEQEQDQEQEQSAEDVENRDPGTDVLEFQDLEIIDHEATVEEQEYGDDQFVVTGVVENHSDDKYDSVTVGVRAYNADGHQIDRFIDHTSDLQGGGTWAFEVTALGTPAEEIEDWDIGVSGLQY